MTTINALDPIEHLRARRQMYLPESGSLPLFLAQRLSGDAMVLGANLVNVAHEGDWWGVAADRDWLVRAGETVSDLFSRMIPFPEAGVNSIRSEVLLTAFAEEIVTSNGGGPQIIKGSGTAPTIAAFLTAAKPWARIVQFRL